jgi:hypothetical protein
MAKTISYSCEGALEKSKKFLKDILGKELFDKFFEEGKIDVESGGKVYELYDSGRIVNKSTNQAYCIVPTRPDYPIYDVIAIKYAWLKYGLKTVEKVANKTSLTYRSRNASEGRRDGVGYDAFTHYMEQQGWAREQMMIDEQNTNFVSTHSVGLGTSGTIIDIRCPAGYSMSTKGMVQIPEDMDKNAAYTYSLHITDKNRKEINGFNIIRIEKIKPSEEVIQLARVLYSDMSSLRCSEDNNERNLKKAKGELYRWRNGIILYGGYHLRTYVINSNVDICSDNVKMNADFDLWMRRL